MVGLLLVLDGIAKAHMRMRMVVVTCWVMCPVAMVTGLRCECVLVCDCQCSLCRLGAAL